MSKQNPALGSVYNLQNIVYTFTMITIELEDNVLTTQKNFQIIHGKRKTRIYYIE